MKYRNVGDHAEDLADGRMVAPGEFIELDDDQTKDGRNADLVSSGIFMTVDEVQSTDAARKLAEDKGITLAAVTGTGKDGQVTERDVERHARETGEEGK